MRLEILKSQKQALKKKKYGDECFHALAKGTDELELISYVFKCQAQANRSPEVKKEHMNVRV